MPPAELNHWAATDVMGWTREHTSDGFSAWFAYFEKIDAWPYKKEVETLPGNWHPDKCHNQCQQVIEKAIELAVDPHRIYGFIESADWKDNGWHAGTVYGVPLMPMSPLPHLLATPEQKLRAVHAAWQERE